MVEPVSARPTVVLTDHPWPTLELEHAIVSAAGLELVAGPEAAGSAEEVEELIERANPVAILTCWAPVSKKAINLPSHLAIVARLGVGLDNIEVAAATKRGSWVTNVPDYCVSEVSDHAIALMLAHYRGIVRLDALTKAAGWQPTHSSLERIRDLTVGVVGYGRIGKETSRKLRVFGCRVLACSPSFQERDGNAEPADLATLQARADVIILHAPLTAVTSKLVDGNFLAGCQRRPLIINVSRGGLVDNQALLEALESGRIRGAALDVIDGEPFPPAALYEHPHVIATPHVAFASTASTAELRQRACEEVVRVLRGEQPHHPCNDPR
jgi:D-3-phosphoglycerate dehydrogenase